MVEAWVVEGLDDGFITGSLSSIITKYTIISGMLNKQKEITDVTCLYVEHSLFL